MKIITSLLTKITAAILLITISSCSIEPLENEDASYNDMSNQQSLTCTNTQPMARLVNNGSINYEFKIISVSSGQIVEFLSIAPGTSSSWTSFSEGDILFVINSNTTGISDIKTQEAMLNCETYELEVLSNNTLANGSPVSN